MRIMIPGARVIGRAVTFAALAVARVAFAGPAEDKGLELARKAERANEGFFSEKAVMTLELVNAHGDVTKRRMRMELLEGADGDKSLSSFEWPADVNGTKLLTVTRRHADDDQWLYLPAVKRTKRIASSNRSGSFMGSEFAYEDLSAQEVEKFTYRYIDDQKVGDRDCTRVERVPVSKDSGYRRQVTWIDKEYMNPLRVEYYDRKNELLKVASFTGYKKHGRFWRWTAISIENKQTRKRSVLTWETRELGARVDSSRFEASALEE